MLNQSLKLPAALSVSTLVWTAIIALEGPFHHYYCQLASGWISTICRIYPYLRGPGEWPPEWRWWLRYPVKEGGPLFDIIQWRLAILLPVVGLGIVWWLWTKKYDRMSLLQLVILAVLGFMLIVSVQFLDRGGIPLAARLISPLYEPQYFLPAGEITDVRSFVAEHQLCLQTNSCATFRMNSHPPGNVLFFWGFYRIADGLPPEWVDQLGQILRTHSVPEWVAGKDNRTLTAAGMAGVAIPAMAALSVIPVYILGYEMVGHLRARTAAILFLLTPALPLFAPVVDLVFVTWSSLGFLLAYLAFSRRSYLVAAGMGIVLSAAAFMSFSTLPLVLMIILMAFGLLWTSPKQTRVSVLSLFMRQGVVAFGAAALVWMLAGANPFEMFTSISANYWHIQTARSYWGWLVYGPYDLWFFAGTPVAVLCVMAVVRLARKIFRGSEPVGKDEVWLASVVLTLAVLFIGGRLRGEVARTLLYVFPLLALASQIKTEKMSDVGIGLIATATLLQNITYYNTLNVYH